MHGGRDKNATDTRDARRDLRHSLASDCNAVKPRKAADQSAALDPQPSRRAYCSPEIAITCFLP